MTHSIELTGCPPHILANYLKTLAVLRLVATQVDPAARGQWRDGTFVLTSKLSREELCRFFLDEYLPTPLIAPWNGGSGFYPKDNREALDAIANGSAARFVPFREAIAVGREVTRGRKERPADEEKIELIRRARADWPETLLPWLGAALSLGDDDIRYPALLGTGGNDGRLDFTNNQMARLVELFDPNDGKARAYASGLLTGALFGEPVEGLEKRAIGQFLPGGAGGANATQGFSADSLVNLWDFVFAIEGTITFQVAALRRLETSGGVQASAPFAVRSRAAGYPSATAADEGNARGEQWMPLWSGRASWPEVKKLFDEGRMFSAGARATNSVQAAIGLSSMGAARGVAEFERFGFVERNGQANLAVPLGRWRVQASGAARVVEPFEEWIGQLRRAAEKDGAPAGMERCVRGVEAAMMNALRVGGARAVTRLFADLAAAEEALVRSSRWAKEHRLQPLPTVGAGPLTEFIGQSDWQTRVAAALAAYSSNLTFEDDRAERVSIRWNCLPLERPHRSTDNARFMQRADSLASTPREVWGGTLIDSLCAVLDRRLTEGTRTGAQVFARSRITVSESDLAHFLADSSQDRELQRLVRGFMCVNWTMPLQPDLTPTPLHAPALFAAFRLTYPTNYGSSGTEEQHREDPRPARLLLRGRGESAFDATVHRLRASGIQLAIDPLRHHVTLAPADARRLVASLLMPVDSATLATLTNLVVRKETRQ